LQPVTTANEVGFIYGPSFLYDDAVEKFPDDGCRPDTDLLLWVARNEVSRGLRSQGPEFKSPSGRFQNTTRRA